MSVYTPLDDSAVQFGDAMTVEEFQAISADLDHLMDSVPPGMIVPVLYGLTGVPQPDARIWQLCDGSDITDDNSPLRGYSTPDYATLGRYLKGADAPGTIGNTGGSLSHSLAHAHGGATGGWNATDNGCDQDDDFYTSTANHTHFMGSALATTIFEPIHYKINFYLKIA